MRFTFTATVLDSPDAVELARFYQRLMGWEVRIEESDWVILSAPDGGAGLSFQTETNYVRPVWPAGPTDPPMMMHLDIQVDDLDEAGAHAGGPGRLPRGVPAAGRCAGLSRPGGPSVLPLR
ncbi:VOC family protein [Arthrobacter sp. 260]|uniref:VOC family protein n=1 Tax=Arthrobacter sp. 260 TaxID=2735314 RepID=UPI001E451CAA